MIQIQTIEQYIEELDDNSFAKLRDWFIEFEQARWNNKKHGILKTTSRFWACYKKLPEETQRFTDKNLTLLKN